MLWVVAHVLNRLPKALQNGGDLLHQPFDQEGTYSRTVAGTKGHHLGPLPCSKSDPQGTRRAFVQDIRLQSDVRTSRATFVERL